LPGNFGTGYFFTELALKPFAIHLQSAAIYAIILHALVTLPPLLVSPIYLLLSGIDVKSIKAMSQKLGVTI
jgi:hypothetical protein